MEYTILSLVNLFIVLVSIVKDIFCVLLFLDPIAIVLLRLGCPICFLSISNDILPSVDLESIDPKLSFEHDFKIKRVVMKSNNLKHFNKLGFVCLFVCLHIFLVN